MKPSLWFYTILRVTKPLAGYNIYKQYRYNTAMFCALSSKYFKPKWTGDALLLLSLYKATPLPLYQYIGPLSASPFVLATASSSQPEL